MVETRELEDLLDGEEVCDVIGEDRHPMCNCHRRDHQIVAQSVLLLVSLHRPHMPEFWHRRHFGVDERNFSGHLQDRKVRGEHPADPGFDLFAFPGVLSL